MRINFLHAIFCFGAEVLEAVDKEGTTLDIFGTEAHPFKIPATPSVPSVSSVG
jgi:hypothetical protein